MKQRTKHTQPYCLRSLAVPALKNEFLIPSEQHLWTEKWNEVTEAMNVNPIWAAFFTP
ncbi:MAG: hypothetical protein MJA29_06455 [Candidatus Omnitrophica bacterium]|nr:hypothetical protein [Candidatus Omnitrophota bacterium]